MPTRAVRRSGCRKEEEANAHKSNDESANFEYVGKDRKEAQSL